MLNLFLQNKSNFNFFARKQLSIVIIYRPDKTNPVADLFQKISFTIIKHNYETLMFFGIE